MQKYKDVMFDEEPIEINLYIHISPAKSTTKKEYNRIIGHCHTKKPDLDNCVKAILDGLNGVAYRDDSTIARMSAVKRWGSTDSIEVVIREIEDD